MVSARKDGDPNKARLRPAATVEGRENQITALAVDLIEKQIREGTVSATVLSHYAKTSSSQHMLEMENLKKKNALLEAQVEAMGSQKETERLMGEAIKAFTSYQDGDQEEYYED